MSGAGGSICVLAKEPVAGLVKTRLSPCLSPGLAVEGVPGDGTPVLEALAARLGWAVEPQAAGDLGRRMRQALADGLRHGPTVLLGADSPDLPGRRIRQALEALTAHDAVLGPAGDGGYYLVGARCDLADLFPAEVVWGGPQVLAVTLASLARRQASVHLLEPWRDVDDADDLAALAARLRRGGLERALDGAEAMPANASLALLQELAREGVNL